MVVWSSIYRTVANTGQLSTLIKPNSLVKVSRNALQIRHMSDHGPRMFNITPSRFQWHKFKDLLHFYTLLGLIPVGLIVFYSNVFVGPATLTPIPDDYVPKHWEYYRHPITRFFARYIYPSPQQEYEKNLHAAYEENEKIKLRELEKKVQAKIKERKDYQAYYYRPITAKYIRMSKEAADYLESIWGDN